MPLSVGLSAAEMKYEAQIIYESIASAHAPGFTDKEWSVLLTQAQEKVVKNIIKDGIDRNEENRRAIETLIKPATFGVAAYSGSVFPNAYTLVKASNSDNIFHLIDEFALVGTAYIKIKPITYEYYFSNHNNPFRKPSIDEDGYFWKLVQTAGTTSTSEIIITDGSIMTQYKCIFVQRPTPIIITALTDGTTIDKLSTQTDCALHHSVHREIVKQAATLAFAYLQEQAGYQMQKIENKENV